MNIQLFRCTCCGYFFKTEAQADECIASHAEPLSFAGMEGLNYSKGNKHPNKVRIPFKDGAVVTYVLREVHYPR